MTRPDSEVTLSSLRKVFERQNECGLHRPTPGSQPEREARELEPWSGCSLALEG